MFNQVYFQDTSEDAGQVTESEANVLSSASSDSTPIEPQAEVLNMFINTQTERDIIECNIDAEQDKMENIYGFSLGKEDLVDECIANLDGIDSAVSLYSVYN